MALTIAEEKQLLAVQQIAKALPEIAKALTRIAAVLEKRNGDGEGKSEEKDA